MYYVTTASTAPSTCGLNRHLNDIGLDFDIVRDKQFKTANEMLDAKLKSNVELGISRPTKHKAIICETDLNKIDTYLNSEVNPVLLRYRVWYNLAIHFGSRGLEFHKQLNINSFQIQTDQSNNTEYVVLTHETRQKNFQGGLESEDSPSDKRMYATQTDTCPVAALRLLLERTDQSATSLFNHCSKPAMLSPQNTSIWYTDHPVKPYQFTRLMGDICKNSQCSQTYTSHCLRATAIQALNDAGFELRHIMYMSGHRNESSVRSYNRECSDKQKETLSKALSAVASPSNSDSCCNELVLSDHSALRQGHVE